MGWFVAIGAVVVLVVIGIVTNPIKSRNDMVIIRQSLERRGLRVERIRPERGWSRGPSRAALVLDGNAHRARA